MADWSGLGRAERGIGGAQERMGCGDTETPRNAVDNWKAPRLWLSASTTPAR